MCPNVCTEQHTVRLHGETVKPSLPPGWHSIDNNIICNRHDSFLRAVEKMVREAQQKDDDKIAAPEVSHGESSGAAK